VFPSKEAGDYFNNNVILLKYNLDLEDPDGIMEKYSVRAYPTFVFVDGDGNEYARFLGGANDTNAFLEKTKNALKPENSWAYREAKLKSDPSYTMEHIRHLNSAYMHEPARELLNKTFATRSVQENFSEESVRLYNSLITDINSPVVDFMIQNQREVSEVMGAEEYRLFLTSKANAQLGNKLMRMDIEKPESVADVENDVIKIVSNPLLVSKYSEFLANNFGHIKNKDHSVIFEHSTKALPAFNPTEINMIISLNASATRILKTAIDPDVLRQRSIALYEIAMEFVTDSRVLENYQRALDRLKNTP